MQGLKLQKPVGVVAIKFLTRVFIVVLSGIQGLVMAQEVFIPEKVKITGLHRTKPRIVLRELAFRPGIPLFPGDTAALFSKTSQNIFNTKLFNYASYHVDSVWVDTCGRSYGQFHIDLHERWYTFPYPIFELSDRNFNEWWYDRNADLRRVNIGLRFIQKNVRGLNEDLVVAFQGGFTRRIDFSYLIPYLDKKQTWGLRFGASGSNNKDVAVRSENNRLVFKRDENGFGRERYGAFVSLSKRKSIYNYHFFDAYYSYNRITPFIFGENPRYFLDSLQFQRFSEIRYTFLYDKRDFRYFGTNGFVINAYVGKMGLLPSDNLRLWTTRYVGAFYKPLSSQFFWASRLDLEWSFPYRQPYLGTRSLGFENRFVRGYERYVMEGPVNGYTRNSLRWKAASLKFRFPWFPLRQFQIMPMDVYFTGFGDAGYVHNPHVYAENKKRVNSLLVGYGLGLNLVTFYDVVFRLEWSTNIHGDQGVYISFLSDI